MSIGDVSSARGLVRCIVLCAVALALDSCSSGLEGGGGGDAAAAQPAPSTNLRFGFDTGFELTHPVTDFDVTGGVLPAAAGAGERPVAFFAFVTATPADLADGSGNTLDPDGAADGNGASDVFLAAVDLDAVDPRAFVYAIAGKMRHPRCTTCHQLNVDVAADPDALPPTAFATGAHPLGKPPFGDTGDETCKQCHIPDWFAPAANFDLRDERTAALFARAQIAPSDLAEHFLGDPRVEWALGDGRSPFGESADDDHDGIAEPEDTDGVRRTVPGGIEDFRRRFEDWEASGLAFDSREALRDLALVSRNAAGAAAGNAGASAPSAVYAPNPGYVHGVSDPDAVPVGSVFVAFVSEATDMLGGTANGVADVFRATVDVFQRSDGALDLVPAGHLTVSVDAGGGDANGASGDPDVGAGGTRVAFHSLATDLVAGGAAADNVYVFDAGAGTHVLVSHVPGAPTTAGNGPSRNPDLSPDGRHCAFESDASDLVADDTNGVRDVFVSDLVTLVVERASVAADGAEATGGDSRNASVHGYGAAGARVAFESDARDLVPELPLAATNVFLRDTRGTGTTLLLNQSVGPDGVRLARATAADGGPAPADASRPVIGAGGDVVLFESLADELDFVRRDDENRALDVMLADLLQLDAQGFVLPYAVSVGADGGRANGDSSRPRLGAFAPATDAFPLGIAAFATRATNLANPDPADLDGDGVPDGDNHLLLALREGASVLAHFEARPAVQGQGLEVTFEDQSSGAPTAFLWDFGDGGTSTERDPTHVYASPGTYDVRLEASGELGSDARLRAAAVRILGPVMAAFTGTKDASSSGAAAQGAAVDVPNTATIVGAIDDASPTTFLAFDFDSAPSTELPDEFEWSLVEVDSAGDPVGPPVVVSTDAVAEDVVLDRLGLFDVVLDARGPGGSGAARQRIEVWQSVEALFSAPGTITGNAPLSVSFMDQSTGDVASWLWDFDDGSTSAQQSPMHVFGEGVFDVVLSVTGRGSDTDASPALQIVSFGDITANFTATPSEAVASGPVNVAFSNTTTGTIGVPLAFRWDFGNSQTSTATNPSTSYSLASPENRQSFAVTLVASTTAPAPPSCAGMGSTECDQITRNVTLFPALSVDFSFGSSFAGSATRPPHTVAFTGSVVGDGTGTNPSSQWFRSAPGGATASTLFSTSLSPTFEFPAPGVYRVFLRVSTDAPGSSRQSADSATKNVTVSAATFTQFFDQAVVASACTSCHSGATPPAGLDWTGPASAARARLVNVTSGCNAALVRVAPSNPSGSTTFLVLDNAGPSGTCDSMRVNLSGNATDHVDVLESWILSGAPNN